MAPRKREHRTGEHRRPNLSAEELYQQEKARRAGTKPPDERMLAAQREYEALLAADAARGKGGRPRKAPAKVAPKTAATAPEDLEDELDDEAEDAAPSEDEAEEEEAAEEKE